MTRDAALVAVVISAMTGYFWARWRRAELTQRAAQAGAAAAGKAAWRARVAMLAVGLALYAVIDVWLRGKGR